MAVRELTVPEPVEGVLFDFHSTLVDQGSGADWLRLARERAGLAAGVEGEDTGADSALAARLEFLWERAREIDPDSTRDLDPASHRSVFDTLMGDLVRTGLPPVGPALGDALYETLLAPWTPYDDTRPVLEALRERGVRTAVMSNIGIDIRPVLDRHGLGDLFDAVVLSCEVGAVKPGPEIFRRALDLLGLPAGRALMVGDAWTDDGGAAALGVRTLILPRTAGPVHGLHLVVSLVEGSRRPPGALDRQS